MWSHQLIMISWKSPQMWASGRCNSAKISSYPCYCSTATAVVFRLLVTPFCPRLVKRSKASAVMSAHHAFY